MNAAEKGSGGATIVIGILSVIFAWFETYAAGIGAMCALVTLMIYAYVTLSRNKREKEQFELKMKEIEKKEGQ